MLVMRESSLESAMGESALFKSVFVSSNIGTRMSLILVAF